MNNRDRELIRDAVELGATLALERLGMTAGEVSQRQARRLYGSYFATLVQQGRIAPVHEEPGRAGTKFYRIADILQCKVEDRTAATLIP